VHVAVLSGGISWEREVSLRSGSRVAGALRDLGHHVRTIDVDADLVRHLSAGDIDAVFLTLHGSAGEDGTIQSILDLLGLPYTGSGALASALAWNKAIAQGLYARAGVDVPAHVTLSQQAFREMGAAAAISRIADELGPKVVVKPITGGSSLGLTLVQSRDQLPQAIMGAFSFADGVLIEECIDGIEVAVSVVGGEALPAVEIVPKDGVYDFSARYTAGTTDFHVPARLSPDRLEECALTALRAVGALGAKDVLRADMIVHEQRGPVLLEADTCPGLTETSLLPLAAQAAGQDFGSLCQQLLTLATTD
jgi:D-alanine-D-alanine ligase